MSDFRFDKGELNTTSLLPNTFYEHTPPPLQGLKFDNDKPRMDLIPPELLTAVATILTFGANKYTTTLWSEFCNVVNAREIRLYIANQCVVHVMKNNLGQPILVSQKNNEKIVEIGDEKTQKEFLTWLDVEKKIQDADLGTLQIKEGTDLKNLELPQNKLMNSVEEAVKFAEQRNFYTLITTIKQGNLEEYYVASTTTVLGSLGMTLKGLKPQLNISDLRPKTGDRNWEKGMDWGRPYSALLRHLLAWHGGEDKDPETGLSHLWHVATNAAFLLTYEERKIGNDNRPIRA